MTARTLIATLDQYISHELVLIDPSRVCALRPVYAYVFPCRLVLMMPLSTLAAVVLRTPLAQDPGGRWWLTRDPALQPLAAGYLPPS